MSCNDNINSLHDELRTEITTVSDNLKSNSVQNSLQVIYKKDKKKHSYADQVKK